VLAVGLGGALQRLGEVAEPREARSRRPPEQARVDLLQQPAVAVRVAERHERLVVGVLRRRTGPALRAAEHGVGAVEDLAHVDAPRDEIACAASMSETASRSPPREPDGAELTPCRR